MSTSTSTHTLNPNTGREITINGVHFLNLLKHGFKYNEELNRLYNTPLPPDTPKYIPKFRMISPNNHSIIIGGLAYYELLWDNYRSQGGKWVKMRKKEVKEYDNDLNISTIFASDTNNSSYNSDYPDNIDEFEYDKNGHASSHSRTSPGINYEIDWLVVLVIVLTNCYLYFHFGHVDILSKPFITYT